MKNELTEQMLDEFWDDKKKWQATWGGHVFSHPYDSEHFFENNKETMIKEYEKHPKTFANGYFFAHGLRRQYGYGRYMEKLVLRELIKRHTRIERKQ